MLSVNIIHNLAVLYEEMCTNIYMCFIFSYIAEDKLSRNIEHGDGD